MEGKELMQIAMALGEPKRVPVMCQLAIGHYFLQSSEDAFRVWYTSEGFARALVELALRYGFDGVLVNLPGRDPEIEKWIERIEAEPGKQIIHFKNGGKAILPADDNARYIPPEAERQRITFSIIDPEKLYYVEPWDVTEASYPYKWGFEEVAAEPESFFPSYHSRAIGETLKEAKGKLSVHAEVFSPFSQFIELLGIKEGMLALVDDPGKVKACLERLTEGALDQAIRHASCGADALLISSAYAGGGFISRLQYQEFVLPYERELIARFKQKCNIPVYTHTCGAIGDRLDLMLETGTNGIDTLDPPPLGNVDLREAKRLLKGRAFIKGNVDPVNTLLKGTPEKVKSDALTRLRIAAVGGGYVLSSACSVPPRTPPENIMALREAAELFCRQV